MDESYLYLQIAESIRQEILAGGLQPGERLPSVRQLREQWHCTPGTVQRAYKKLAGEGLLTSHAGRGTQVAETIPQAKTQAQETLRRANLVNHSEAFLLEALTGGYTLVEVQQAMDLAMDRWRSLEAVRAVPVLGVVRCTGSHDMLLNDLAHAFFGQIEPGYLLQLAYIGSLGGLTALAEGKTDLAGCHLWDVESDSYNLPYIQRVLPGKSVVGVTLAHRRLGFILAPGNPHKIQGLEDLTRQGIRFTNRQPGSGTRVWLDAMLKQKQIQPDAIHGYRDERQTHSDVARVVAEGGADVGLGLETAARAYGLDFLFLNRERYDLVMLAETIENPPVRKLIDWLASEQGRQFVDQHRGYDSQSSGQVWTIS